MVRGQWANFAKMLGLHHYSFSKDILGFLMTTESHCGKVFYEQTSPNLSFLSETTDAESSG